MSVYVDALFSAEAFVKDRRTRAAGKPHGHRWCHLMADTLDELHGFALLLGLRRSWSQGDHYDLTPPRRAEAVRLGAKEVSGRELVQIRRRLRAGGGA